MKLEPLLAAAIIALTLAVEWHLFESSVRALVLPTFPAHHDQTAYLIHAYANDAEIERQGLWRAIANRVTTGSATGSLLDLEAALAFRAVEPNRLGALSVLFAHFAALQITFLYVAWWATGSLALGIVAVALLASSGFLFVVPGGLFDFRIDAAASCAFGIFVAALVRSQFYRQRAWSMAAGIAAAYLIALRHNMIAHLAVLHAVFLVAILRRRRGENGAERAINFCCSIAAMTALSAPFVYFSRVHIAEYYIGQVASRGPVRTALSGRSALVQLAFYPYNVAVQHVRFMPLIAGLAALVPWLGIGRGSSEARPLRYAPLLLVTIAVPLAILTLHSNRSTTVAGLVLPPIALLVTFALAERGRVGGRSALVASLIVLAVGLAVHGAQHAIWRAAERPRLADGAAIFDMHYRIASICAERGLHAPAYLTDTLEDEIEPAIGATALFERERRYLVPHNPAVREQIFAVGEPELGRIAAASDVILLQTRGERIPYPYVQAVAAAREPLDRAIREHFVEIGNWSFTDSAATAYVARRP